MLAPRRQHRRQHRHPAARRGRTPAQSLVLGATGDEQCARNTPTRLVDNHSPAEMRLGQAQRGEGEIGGQVGSLTAGPELARGQGASPGDAAGDQAEPGTGIQFDDIRWCPAAVPWPGQTLHGGKRRHPDLGRATRNPGGELLQRPPDRRGQHLAGQRSYRTGPLLVSVNGGKPTGQGGLAGFGIYPSSWRHTLILPHDSSRSGSPRSGRMPQSR